MKIFMIMPVRGITERDRECIMNEVYALESKGHKIHLPIRDTDQTGTGYAICAQNQTAIKECDFVYMWYDAQSIGSIFDLGTAMALDKPLKVINRDALERTEGKSFVNVILDYSDLW